MADVIATMVTMTTYGTWLRGDRRGWVDRGIVKPADPELEAADRRRLKHAPFRFDQGRLLEVGEAMGASLIERKRQSVLALTVQTWHSHFVVAATELPISEIVKCAKDAVRWLLRLRRPIWTDGYDERYCYCESDVLVRVAYIERHNDQMGWPTRPWSWMR